MIAPHSSPTPSGRLVDIWPGGTDRDPAAVVAEHRKRAPECLRRQMRPLTRAERRLFRYIGDPAWMKTPVFAQVPISLPELNRGRVFGFFVPIRAVGIEIGPLESIVDHMEEDELLREHAGVATMRCPEDMVLRDARAVAESIRWDLGLEDGDGRYHGFNVPVPRAGTGGPP